MSRLGKDVTIVILKSENYKVVLIVYRIRKLQNIK